MTQNRGANRQGFSTRAIHAGYHPRDGKGALNPPVYMTSTYAFESAAEGAAIAGHAKDGHLYGRRSNPGQDILEERLADLEGGEAAIVFASGMGAIASFLLTALSAGDRVIAHETVYVNTHALFEEAFPRFGIEVVRANLHDPDSLDGLFDERTRLVYFETPSNPTMDVLDIAAIAARAHARGAKVAVDSTFASPALQRPLELGADYVLHSLTKYVSGHGDLLAGALIGDRDTVEAVRDQGLNYITGAVIAPLNVHLLLRGLKTLGPRMRLHGENALALARYLEGHPAVAWVRYPGLESHPDHDVAQRQMANGGAMLAFAMKSGFDGAAAVIDRVNLITRAVSLGDAETLIIHPAGLSRGREETGVKARLSGSVDQGLIRLSVGLEEVEDLIADFEAAFRGL